MPAPRALQVVSPFVPMGDQPAAIAQLSAEKFSPEKYHDEYRDRVRAAVEQKAAGIEVSAPAEQPQAQIIDLFEALKRSLEEKGNLPVTPIANDAPPVEAEAPPESTEAAIEDVAKPLKKASARKSAPREKKAAGGEG